MIKTEIRYQVFKQKSYSLNFKMFELIKTTIIINQKQVSDN